MRLNIRSRCIQYKIHGKRGSLAVETAIFLPIFILGVLMLIYLIKVLWIEERVFFTFQQEASKISDYAYVGDKLESNGSLETMAFKGIVKGKLYNDHEDDILGAEFTEYKYMFTNKGLSGLVLASLKYEVNIKLPIDIYPKVPIEDSLLFRGFIGADLYYEPVSFEEMKKKKEVIPVWIFPRAGERYHKEGCGYIKNQPRQLVLNSGIIKKYDPCKLCRPGELKTGNIVYCFTKTGEAYHKGSCYSVEKYVKELNKEEAVEMGYSACMKCGGS